MSNTRSRIKNIIEKTYLCYEGTWMHEYFAWNRLQYTRDDETELLPQWFFEDVQLRESEKGLLFSFGMEYPGAILHVV